MLFNNVDYVVFALPIITGWLNFCFTLGGIFEIMGFSPNLYFYQSGCFWKTLVYNKLLSEGHCFTFVFPKGKKTISTSSFAYPVDIIQMYIKQTTQTIW